MYPQVFGKYVLERELARGGMARVLLATLKGAGGFEKKLVVKQIRDELAFDDEFITRFVEEAKTTVALSHPNIVPVYELGVELGTYYLAMEFVEGLSVTELLAACAREGNKLSPEEGAYIGVEVCRALDYAHRRMKVVHRDVTPRNVMLDEEGQVKVIDFGIAARARVAGHEVFGSPGHMPPEQVEGKELSPATDVFQVAVLLLELWSGKPPFRSKDAGEADRKMRGEHPKASDVDIRLLPLDPVIASALALDPVARPQQADDLARALRKFLAGVDLGDLARSLGERVRTARANPAPREAPKKRTGLERPPSRPSAAEIRTKTFAAREEVEKWAPSNPPELETREIATKAMPKSIPPEAGTQAKTPANAAKNDGRADATGPSQAVVPDAIETIATRPIETDGSREREKARARGANKRAGWMVAAAIAIAGVATFAVLEARDRTSTTPAPTTTTATIASETARPTASVVTSAGPSAITTASAVTTASALPSASAIASATASTTASATTTSTTTATATQSASSLATEKAQLFLYGEGTTVTVDGAARGPCPTRAMLDPGVHTVHFTFKDTGESRGQSIVLKSGERVTMRADFTGATPTIRIQR